LYGSNITDEWPQFESVANKKVPNLLFIRVDGVPRNPRFEKGWKARTTFEQYAISFQPLRRVIWSIVGSGGQVEGNELPWVLELAEGFPNIEGVFMDDFLVRDKNDPNMRRGAYSPAELADLKRQLVAKDRRLEMWVTLYTHSLDPTHPSYHKTDIPLADYLKEFDVISFWTWDSKDLRDLEQNLGRLEMVLPRARIALGCYLWDFPNQQPVPLSLMKHQIELGLKWLLEGRISEMVFLSNNVMDLGLEVVEWTREWIAEVGEKRLAR
jgi:hypothetical protein